jgi:predicted amidohydrolase
MTSRIKTYTGLVIQPHVKVARDRDDIRQNLDRVCNMIDFGVGYYWELPARLAVLPEYFLQGVTTPGKGEDGLEQFMKKAITIPGPETEVLGRKAKQYGMYIAGGGAVERHPSFRTAGSTPPSSSVRTATLRSNTISGTCRLTSVSGPVRTT